MRSAERAQPPITDCRTGCVRWLFVARSVSTCVPGVCEICVLCTQSLCENTKTRFRDPGYGIPHHGMCPHVSRREMSRYSSVGCLALPLGCPAATSGCLTPGCPNHHWDIHPPLVHPTPTGISMIFGWVGCPPQGMTQPLLGYPPGVSFSKEYHASCIS